NHQDRLPEILDHIEAISAEWRRREEELARRRERVYAARLRQETITRHAIEQVSNGTLDNFSDAVSTDGGDGAEVGERRFKACNLCGILVDADSPAAMESHLRAHKKNDDLKLKLLARYGPEEVSRLMCNECNMVFADEVSLIVHNQQMHTRRKKYVCKWCGHVAYTMTELNIHKADVHAMPPFTARSDRDRIMRGRRHIQGRGLVALGANPRHNEIDDRHGATSTPTDEYSFRFVTCLDFLLWFCFTFGLFFYGTSF
ncbi:zinc finger, C2H2 type, partial [Oesophagostomum dentatum]